MERTGRSLVTPPPPALARVLGAGDPCLLTVPPGTRMETRIPTRIRAQDPEVDRTQEGASEAAAPHLSVRTLDLRLPLPIPNSPLPATILGTRSLFRMNRQHASCCPYPLSLWLLLQGKGRDRSELFEAVGRSSWIPERGELARNWQPVRRCLERNTDDSD